MDSALFADSFQEINQRLIKLVGDLSALRALSDLDLQAPDEACLLHDALRVLMENNCFDRCSVFLLEDDSLHCVAGLAWAELAEGKPARPPHSRRFRLGEGIIGMAAETGHLQHCRDTRQAPRFVADDSGTGALICSPITHNGQVLGVLNVSHGQPGFFQGQHEQLLQAFANFLGQILSNWRYTHRMEAEIRRRTRELEAALGEAEELRRRYQHLSIIDELTGIHNRRFFFPEAQAALANAVRHRHPFTIMMVDLDHFKKINDVHGHAMGDKVLQVAAALLKGQTRGGDIIARFGGEEFILALPNTDLEGARQLADRILQSLRGIAFSAGHEALRVTASIGLSELDATVSPDQPDLLETLLRQADQALYFGKAHGRDQTRSYPEICRLS
ncbi:sensor domain-containing diguanylate cyclase [Thiohalobacter sp. IOR34]|uniref:sensor domain-containing diguanylate cyclase n=1 Tax=Thiohalobacter sp. IOR34 TaxID=3057176 RepID=UPI0025AF0759|nr:sensor domain-containing diguanylate cyclase [Thiohalobacter sp. IOR34]WJW75081.1 sensor domain-containing diguanylate cyclase [Thiohalobacter sp. IOR34]